MKYLEELIVEEERWKQIDIGYCSGSLAMFDEHICTYEGVKVGTLFTRERKWETIEYTELHITVADGFQGKGFGPDMIKQFVNLYGPVAIVKGRITNPVHIGKMIDKMTADPWFSISDEGSYYHIEEAF